MRILSALLLFGLFVCFGCSNPSTPSQSNDIEAFFAGVSPIISGEVGEYTYTGNDGTIETGILISDDNGNISLQSDRGSSVYSNFWFNLSIDYLSPRYYTGMGLPVYYLGDNFAYDIHVDYKRCLPLNAYPIIYSKMTSEMRYWPSMGLLPGDSVEVWDPFSLDPYEYKVVNDTFQIVPGTIPGNDCTVVKIDLQFLFGCYQFNLANGVCGFWDP